MASIRRKPNSKYWYACFSLPDGTRTQRSTKTTDRKAAMKIAFQFEQASNDHLTESQARKVIADIYRNHSGRRLESASVKDYLTRWSALRKGTVAATTHVVYEATVGEFVGHLGDRALKDLGTLTTSEVADYRDKISERLSGSSVNKRLKILRVALQQAGRDGLIDQNPAAKVPTIRAGSQRAERRAFTIKELKLILAVAEAEWKGLILAGLYSGQRLGDLARLQWGDIDLKTQTLTLTTRKTSRRQILPLPKPFLTWLKSTHSEAAAAAGPVFPQAVLTLGGNERVGTLSNQFRRIMEQAGIVTPLPQKSWTPTEAGD
jgi:integrase